MLLDEGAPLKWLTGKGAPQGHVPEVGHARGGMSCREPRVPVGEAAPRGYVLGLDAAQQVTPKCVTEARGSSQNGRSRVSKDSGQGTPSAARLE